MYKKRGRPPKYDPALVLDKAIRVFWEKGLTATSLDDLSKAMNMNRPSIYNAFGDKEAVYRMALARFVQQLGDHLESILFSEPILNKAVKRFYGGALDTYFGNSEPLGCFATCTAIVEVTSNTEIKKDLNIVVKRVDAVLEKRLLKAQQEGDWHQDGNPKDVAKLLNATLQSLAIRARNGESRVSLNKMYSNTVDILC
jgi:AcrR family transcriptional regulator